MDVSWYQEDPARSVRLITDVAGADAKIIDVGGGASRVVDRLVDLGYEKVTVLDLAANALGYAQERLGERASLVEWVQADVTAYEFAPVFDVWHDRAVFHFLTDPQDRLRYAAQVERAVVPGGRVIVATFSLDGPEYCSGLPVQRHSPASIAAALGPAFELLGDEREEHVTPAGAVQHFLYGTFRLRRRD